MWFDLAVVYQWRVSEVPGYFWSEARSQYYAGCSFATEMNLEAQYLGKIQSVIDISKSTLSEGLLPISIAIPPKSWQKGKCSVHIKQYQQAK